MSTEQLSGAEQILGLLEDDPAPVPQTESQAAVVMQAVDKMRVWIKDPVQFVRDVFGVEPDEWQADALCSLRDNPRTGMSACKGPGKSAVLAWGAWWFLSTHCGVVKIVCLSITGKNLKDNLWTELAKWYQQSDFLQSAFQFGGERIKSRSTPETWWISARSFPKKADANEQSETLAGLHGNHVLVVMDEMGDYPMGVVQAADAIFANEEVDNVKVIAAWNPTNRDGPAYRACTIDRPQWNIIEITGDPDDPKRSSRISKKWAQSEIDKWGRDSPYVMVNILGLFPPKGALQLIGADDVLIAQKRDVRPEALKADPHIWGLDPGRFGDDPSVLVRRWGLCCFRPHQWRGLDGVQLATQVAMLYAKSKEAGAAPDAIFVDVGGIGASVYDHLVYLGFGNLVHAIDFANRAKDPSRYFCIRDEMWWDMSQWVTKRPSCLPTDPKFVEELPTPKTEYRIVNKQTVFKLESKGEMRKRGKASPNHGDALALTFAAPVIKQEKALEMQLAEQMTSKAVTDYHPHAVVMNQGHHEHRALLHDPLHSR